MKRKLLKFLPVAAVLLTASCTDDQYDLSDIDTTSQFAVNGLVVPLNMSPIKLDNIISIKDNGDIQEDKKTGNYFFQKCCQEPFKSKDVEVKKITINKPADIHQKVTVALELKKAIQEKWEQYAASKTMDDIRGDAALMSQLDLDDEMVIISVKVEDTKDFNMNATGIEEKITKLDKLSIDPVTLNIDVKLEGLQAVVEGVSVTGLLIELPHGMTVGNISDEGSYAEGKMSFPTLVIDGQKNISATVTELTYNAMAADGANFNPTAHTFTYNKACTVGGTATIKMKDLKGTATLNDIKNAVSASYTCDVKFSDNIVVNKFSGGIYYEVEDINIDPVEINNLPEILQEEGTSIEIANPQLYLSIDNPDFNHDKPFFSPGFTITTGLKITGNNTLTLPNALDLSKASNKKLLSVNDPKETKDFPLSLTFGDPTTPVDPTAFEYESFPDFGQLLSGTKEQKIPETLKIEVEDPVLKDNNVTNFELGKTYSGITGKWEFYAQLSLGENTKIKYTKEWKDWGSDDLNGLNVEKATVNFDMEKEVTLDAESIEFTLNGDGKLYGKTTDVQGNTKKSIEIPMTGGPVKNITGGKLVVNLKGQGKDINTNQKITVSNLRLTVYGNYEKEF